MNNLFSVRPRVVIPALLAGFLAVSAFSYASVNGLIPSDSENIAAVMVSSSSLEKQASSSLRQGEIVSLKAKIAALDTQITQLTEQRAKFAARLASLAVVPKPVPPKPTPTSTPPTPVPPTTQKGLMLEFVSATETVVANSDATTSDDVGMFVIKFDVTAVDNDVLISKSATMGQIMGTAGANFTIRNMNGAIVTTGKSTASLTSTADIEGTRFKVYEGETETFSLTVNYDPITRGFYRLQLGSINFATTNINPTTSFAALPATDFMSDPLSI
jgi:hypothetical protein